MLIFQNESNFNIRIDICHLRHIVKEKFNVGFVRGVSGQKFAPFVEMK